MSHDLKGGGSFDDMPAKMRASKSVLNGEESCGQISEFSAPGHDTTPRHAMALTRGRWSLMWSSAEEVFLAEIIKIHPEKQGGDPLGSPLRFHRVQT